MIFCLKKGVEFMLSVFNDLYLVMTTDVHMLGFAVVLIHNVVSFEWYSQVYVGGQHEIWYDF